MKDAYPDPDPVEESLSCQWYLHEHLETSRFATPAFGEGTNTDLAPAIEPDPVESDPYWPAEVRKANAQPRNRFGRFVLVSQVGCGSAGTVFKAWDSRWKQYAAVKILHAMEPSVLERFKREAPIAASLRHPAIATPYEAGEQDGHWFVAMAFVEGKPIDAEPRPLLLTIEQMRDVCRAMEHAHAAGIAHGDLKPANILVDRLDRITITDFGIPNRLVPAEVCGDVYDLGAILYRVLGGTPYLKGRPLTQLNPQVSPDLADVVSHAMAKNVDDRYATAGELADALDRLLLQRRYSGTYGLTRHLARKWVPVAAAAAVLALILTWIAPSLLPGATAATETESPSDVYKRTAIALLRIEESDDLADPALRAARVKAFTDAHLAGLLQRMPRFLHAQVLKVRSAFAEGDRGKMEREIAALSEFDELDYRLRFFRALAGLEVALARPLPLPAPEAPGPDWAGSPPEWRRFHDDLSAVARVTVEPDSPLSAEYRRDVEAARALLPLVEGQWRVASEKLTALTQSQRLPVYIAARRAASYLARRFDEVLDVPGTQLALAFDSSHSPAEDVKRLVPLVEGDASQEAILYCWAARRCVAQGLDPAQVVAEALAANAGDAEARGILQVALLRGRARVGAAAEVEYRRAGEQLGSRPSSWMGKLAAIESLLGTGRSLKLRGADARRHFEEAINRADLLPSEAGWNAPHLLRAEALVGLGRFHEALTELKQVHGDSVDTVRALLLSSDAHLRLAYAGDARRAKDAISFADRAAARMRNHPEALTRQAAAALYAAETTRDVEAIKEACERLTVALERVPESVEARYHRATALFLLSARAPEHRIAALADLDLVLKAVPELAAARALRGAVRASLGRHAASSADFKEALIFDPGPQAAELRAWLRASEASSQE